MSFRFASVHTIRSPSQRALAEQWDRLAAGRPFPAFTEYRPDPAIHDPKQLVVWNIEGSGRLRKFRALYQGENVADAFNTAWAGKTMEQVVPMSLRRPALDAAKECANSGCIVYMVLSTWDSWDNRIDCERLLLPFGTNGKVEHLLGSLQLTNVPNAARRKRALGHFEIHTEIIKSGRIKSGFTQPQLEEAAAKNGNAAGQPSTDSRRASRRNVRRAARINFARQSLTCMVRDISATGASIEAKDIAGIPDQFRMRIEMESAERRCAVVWRKPTRIGIEFR
ncbi:PilZ domain-containing protein [Bradyrhizobium sp.]|uniref:PilZ domain-containing protein n=1 Tax=Bradyrhizobium sp. TaxID=376 RepID=UPI001DFB16E6|nr:PilZ domain-containing protein [Bradyrhizobium sp.]MBI5318347.1 PilZ domain-containing protein [Bradyrhizobium sp.]